MRVLIAGAGGQIGRALVATAPREAQLSAPSRAELDLTRPETVERAVKAATPDLIINAAGYTAVDRAEAEPDQAAAVNERGAGLLARAAAGAGARMIHYSTDYVFDGAGPRPYTPGDSPNPLNVYGATKLAGERAVLTALGDRAAVIRTAWVYAPEGRNFLLTMLRLMNERDEVRVVSDQIGTPTAAASAAGAAWAIAVRREVHGILHWTDDGTASWFDFAVAIWEEGRELGLVRRDVTVKPIATGEYPTPARRPRYSVLDCSGARAATGLTPEHWRAALRRTIAEIARG
jgi:dTDP-4-dehydrorhamnose reductase